MNLGKILNTFSTALFIYSLKDEEVVMMNQAAKKLFSQTTGDLRKLLNPDDEQAFQYLRTVMETIGDGEEQEVLIKQKPESTNPQYIEVHVRRIVDEGELFAICHAYQVRHRYVRINPLNSKYNVYDKERLFEFLNQIVTLQKSPKNIQNILGHLGELLDVDRVFIFEFLKDRNHCKNTFEWCREGVSPQIEWQKDLDLSKVEWIETLAAHGSLAVSDIQDLDKRSSRLLETQDVESIAAVALYHSDVFYGFLGVDECCQKRSWNADEISILKGIGAVLTSILYREKSLQEIYSYEMFQTVLDNMKTLIYITDIKDHKILFANRTLKQIAGNDNIEGQVCWKVFQHCSGPSCDFCPIHQLFDEDGKPLSPYEWEFFNPALKCWFSITDSVIRWVDGRYVHMEQATDITAIKENEKLLERYATTDMLTGVLKRDWGIRKLEAMLNRSRAHNTNLVIFFIDMDSLKYINDTYGHNVGDTAIRLVAETLAANFRKTDIVCRMGGDEFLVVLEDCAVGYADQIMEKVKAELKTFSEENKERFQVEISIGRIEVKENRYKSADDVIRHADREMYIDKRRNKGRFHRDRR